MRRNYADSNITGCLDRQREERDWYAKQLAKHQAANRALRPKPTEPKQLPEWMADVLRRAHPEVFAEIGVWPTLTVLCKEGCPGGRVFIDPAISQEDRLVCEPYLSLAETRLAAASCASRHGLDYQVEDIAWGGTGRMRVEFRPGNKAVPLRRRPLR